MAAGFPVHISCMAISGAVVATAAGENLFSAPPRWHNHFLGAVACYRRGYFSFCSRFREHPASATVHTDL